MCHFDIPSFQKADTHTHTHTHTQCNDTPHSKVAANEWFKSSGFVYKRRHTQFLLSSSLTGKHGTCAHDIQKGIYIGGGHH